MPDFTGQSIGRYHIIEPLGEGGMAVVYKAYDNILECDVAVKFILAQKLEDVNSEKVLKRFKTEAQKTAALNHPNIIPVTDYGEYEGTPYLVMKYMPGGTLKQALIERLQNRNGPFSYQEAAAILVPIARALELAHYQGIIHRDVKPSNILLTQTGQPMLTDFGVAKITESTVTLDHTGLGTGIGTPEYMAPEQWEGKKEIDGRVDIYGLGVVFYELITGRSPFTADTVPAIMMKVMVDPLPRPKKYCKDIPDSVEKVIFKALARKPENRYSNMGEFAGALEKLTGGKKAGSFLIGWKKTTSEKQDASTHEQTMDTGSLNPQDGHGHKGEFDPGARNPINQPPSKGRKKPVKWYWMLIAGVGILAIAFLSFQIIQSVKPSSTINNPAPTLPPPQSTGTLVATQVTQTGFIPQVGVVNFSPKDGVELIYIPAGKFIMGEKVGVNLNNYPQREVYLNEYWIYKTPVTNEQYKKCVKEGVCSPPWHINSPSREWYYNTAEFSGYPVIYVDWDQARTYCRWAGLRLPTEAQWEKAARGTDGRDYPWGNEIPDVAKVFASVNGSDTVRVGNFNLGKSQYGVSDMGGNVWEWVTDWYDENYYSISPLVNPTGPESGSGRVLRGGPLNKDEGYNKTTIRKGDEPSAIDSSYGFRCAIEDSSQNEEITPTVDKQAKKEIPEDAIYLSSFAPVSAKVGYGEFGVGEIPFDSPEDNVNAGSPLTYWGIKSYDKGLFAHAPSKVEYRLDGDYSKLVTSFFIQRGCGSLDGVIFRILADGKEIFNSGKIMSSTAPEEKEILIDNTKILTLITDPGLSNDNQCDWSVWGDPYLIK